MSVSLAGTPAGRRPARSVLAVVAAIVANATLALGIDQTLHVLEIYPPWGEPMQEPGLNLLALSYRLVIGVASGWLVARLAPNAPERHAMLLGAIATLLATAGAFVSITQHDLGPAWYPIALAALAWPTVQLGAAWQQGRLRAR